MVKIPDTIREAQAKAQYEHPAHNHTIPWEQLDHITRQQWIVRTAAYTSADVIAN